MANTTKMLVNGGITYEKIEKITLTTIFVVFSIIFWLIVSALFNIDFKWWTTIGVSAGFMYSYLSFKDKWF